MRKTLKKEHPDIYAVKCVLDKEKRNEKYGLSKKLNDISNDAQYDDLNHTRKRLTRINMALGTLVTEWQKINDALTQEIKKRKEK